MVNIIIDKLLYKLHLVVNRIIDKLLYKLCTCIIHYYKKDILIKSMHLMCTITYIQTCIHCL